MTEAVGGERRIVSDPPLIVPIEDLVPAGEQERLAEALRQIFRSYRRTVVVDRRRLLEQFRYGHAARKVVGVGSVGTRTWILLLLGRGDDDPLFLQLKEAHASVLEGFVGKSAFANHGQRVVEGQRLTQTARDVLLGWTAPGSSNESAGNQSGARSVGWGQRGNVARRDLLARSGPVPFSFER